MYGRLFGDNWREITIDQAERRIASINPAVLANNVDRFKEPYPADTVRPNLVQPLLFVAERLAQSQTYLFQAVNATRLAAHHAPTGSAYEQAVVSAWVKHLRALPDASERRSLLDVTVAYARADSLLEQQAIAMRDAAKGLQPSVPLMPTTGKTPPGAPYNNG